MTCESADPQSAANSTGPQSDTGTAAPAELTRLRNSIDNVDAALIHILAERFKLTEAVGQLKASSDLPPADPAREARQVERLRSLAEESHLDPEFAEKFLTFIAVSYTHLTLPTILLV